MMTPSPKCVAAESSLAPSPAGEGGFGWRAAAILLPLLLLAGLGLQGVVEDRREVELRARNEALGLCNRIALGLEAQLASDAAEHAAASEAAWVDLLQRARGFPVAPTPEPVARWDGHHPGTPIGSILLPPLVRTREGGLLAPIPGTLPPTPPGWLQLLDASARRGLEEAHRAERAGEAGGRAPADCWRAFGEAAGPEARPFARLGELRASTGGNPADRTRGLEQLLSAEGESESGLPVAALAALELLKPRGEAPAWSPGPVALGRMVDQIVLRHPSMLTPAVIDALEPRLVAAHGPGEGEAPRAARRAVQLGEEAGRLGLRVPVAPGDAWVEDDGAAWLARTSPAAEGGLATRFLPVRVVESIVRTSIETTRPAVPSHLRIQVRVAERALTDRAQRPPGGEARLLGTSPGAKPRVDGAPRVEVEAWLDDPASLYASERRRSLRTAGVILVATVSALWGLLATWRAFQRQRRLAEERSNFVAGVSHELRAPIAAVSLMTENLAGDSPPGPERTREYYDLILQECRRLGGLVENVLDVSRIERGVQQYELEPTGLASLAASTVEVLRHAAARRGVELQYHVTADPGLQVVCDGRAIQQALVNL
ncbi:MAG TPA: hypothetical protein DCM86_11650, partial [Verrucomicrobiales bacterium]|nr:hypothetical protein [Verrucomicrobiales bacterium]